MTDNGNNNENGKSKDKEKEKDDRSVAEVIVDLATENSSLFFKDQYDMPWVRVHKEDHYELIRIIGNKFKRYIGKLYYDSEERVPNAEAINGAASVLQAKAEYDGETIPLSLRVAWDNDSDGIIYDLTDKKWQCVKITKEGWEIIKETSVPLFMRYSQMPQVEPSRQYEPDILDRFLQLVNLKREEDKILLVVYIGTLFIPEIQHVVLQLHGEQGGAKSMLETFIKELVDPARIKLLSVHKDRMEFIQQIAHNHLVFYDNLKYIPGWLSDEVCRGVTGAGGSKRVLYSDDEDFLYDYRRCFGFNGINLVLTEPDVLDRSITIEQDRINPINRVQEKLMMSKFYELRPQLLGYIFDILVKALQIHPTLKLESLPRMGDFALWGEAISRAMGYRELEFINAYDENTGRQNVETIENSPLGQVIVRYLNHWHYDLAGERPACWFGFTSDFLVELNQSAIENNIDTGNHWPKAAQLPNSKT